MIAALPLPVLLAIFAASALVIAITGVIMTGYADKIADRTGLGEAIAGAVILGAATSLSGTVVSVTSAMEGRASLVGALMTAVVTSLPELVTTLAAVRRGALQLAVGGIIGGNTFDTLFLPLSDAAYREGSIYHAAGMGDYFWVVTSLLMTTALLGGLIVRERQGPAGIGFDSLALLGIYAGAVAIQILVPGLG